MVDMSRMPESAMLSVRGMGVAESVSVSTWREKMCIRARSNMLHSAHPTPLKFLPEAPALSW